MIHEEWISNFIYFDASNISWKSCGWRVAHTLFLRGVRRVVVFTQGHHAIIYTVRLDPAGSARLLHVSSRYLLRRDRGKWLRDVNMVIRYN